MIFNEIPWYLRRKFLKISIMQRNEDELDFWLYKQSKIWGGMKRRQRLLSMEGLTG